ncbi:hypothetical protein Q1695_005530 [Nippostrongylus brasiliensis]|nr:hypothetical protein Q1695_005530 [Nippostrongylus brasiliensis]
MATTSTEKKTEPSVVRIVAPAATTTAPQMTDLGGQEPYRGRTPGPYVPAIRERKTVENAVMDLLFEYRVTPHVAMGKAPSEMLMGRQLRTTLDIVKSGKKQGPSIEKE